MQRNIHATDCNYMHYTLYAVLTCKIALHSMLHYMLPLPHQLATSSAVSLGATCAGNLAAATSSAGPGTQAGLPPFSLKYVLKMKLKRKHRYIAISNFIYLDSYIEVLKFDFEIGYEPVRLGYRASTSKFCDSYIEDLISEKLRCGNGVASISRQSDNNKSTDIKENWVSRFFTFLQLRYRSHV
jgi:hypothetical protein